MAERPLPEPTSGNVTNHGWLLLVYKVPSEPSRARVAVWRELKRMGALYLQQAVCILPRLDDLPDRLVAVRQKIAELDGSCFWFSLDEVDPAIEARLFEGFREQSAREYADIILNCKNDVTDQIEMAHTNGFLTFERSEAMRTALTKLKRCLTKSEARDRFGGVGRDEAWHVLERASVALAELESDIAARPAVTPQPSV